MRTKGPSLDGRTAMHMALAGLALLLLGVMCALTASATITGDAPPTTGDWVIEHATTVRDETVLVQGNITVNSTLTLTNSDVLLNASMPNQWSFVVNPMGTLNTVGSTIANANVTDGYSLLILGKASLSRTVINGTHLGLQVKTNEKVSVKNCTILNASGWGLYLVNANSTTVEDTTLDLNNMTMFWLDKTLPDTTSYQFTVNTAAIQITGGTPVLRNIELYLNGVMNGEARIKKMANYGYAYVYWHFYMLLIDGNAMAKVSGFSIMNGSMNYNLKWYLDNRYTGGYWYTYSYTYPHGVTVLDYKDVELKELSIKDARIGTSAAVYSYSGSYYSSHYKYIYPQAATAIQGTINHVARTAGPFSFRLSISDIDFEDLGVRMQPLIAVTLNTNNQGLVPPTYVSNVIIDSIRVDGGSNLFTFTETPATLLFKTYYMNVRISNSTFTNLTGRVCSPTYNVGPGAGQTNLKSFYLYDNLTVERNVFASCRQGSTALFAYASSSSYERMNLFDRYNIFRWNTFRDSRGRFFDMQGRTYQDTGGKERTILDGNTFINNTETTADYLLYSYIRETVYILNNQFISNQYSYGLYLYCQGGDLNGKEPADFVIRNNTFRDTTSKLTTRPVIDVNWGGSLVVSHNTISEVNSWFLRLTEYTLAAQYASVDFNHNKIFNNTGTMIYLAYTGSYHTKLTLLIDNNQVSDNAGPVLDYLIDTNLDNYDYNAVTQIRNNTILRCSGKVFKDYGEVTIMDNHFEDCEDYVIDLKYMYLAPPVMSGNSFKDCNDIYSIVAKEKAGPRMALTMADMSIDCTGNAFFFKNTIVTLKGVVISPRTTLAIIAENSMVDAVGCDIPIGSGQVIGTGSINVWFNIEMWVTWGDAYGEDTHQPVTDALVVRYSRNGMFSGSDLTDVEGHVKAMRYPQWSILDTTYSLWSPYTITVAKAGSMDRFTVDLDKDLVGPDALWFLLIDDFVPQISISSPFPDDQLSVTAITVHGLVVEVGSGLVEATISYGLEGQPVLEVANITVGPTFEFQQTFEGIPEGTIVIKLRVVDSALNTNETMVKLVIDRTPPMLEIVEPLEGAITSDHTITMECMFEQGATVHVNGIAVAGTSGSVLVPIDLTDGSNLIYVDAVDAAGNLASITRSVILDRSPPPLTVLYPSDGMVLDSRTLGVEGDAERGTTLRMSAFGPGNVVLVNNATVIPMTDGTFTHEVELAEGTCVVVVYALDAAGNTARVTRTVTVDTIAPSIEVTSPADNLATNERFIQVTGTVDLEATLLLDGRLIEHEWSFSTPVTLNEGSNTIGIRCLDAIGNERAITLTVVLDTKAPILTIDRPAKSPFSTNTRDIVVAGTVGGDLASLKVGGREVVVGEGGAFETTVTLAADGPADIAIEAVDGVGNTAGLTLHVSVGTTRPVLTVEYTPGTRTVEAPDNTLVIKGTTTPGVTAIEVVHTSGGTTVTDRYSPISHDGSFTIVRRLGDGENSIVLRVVDAFGNTNETQAFSVSYSYVPPKTETVEDDGYEAQDIALILAAFGIALVVSVVVISRALSRCKS